MPMGMSSRELYQYRIVYEYGNGYGVLYQDTEDFTEPAGHRGMIR